MANTVVNKGAIASGIYAFAQTETMPYMFMCTTTAAYNLNGSNGAFTQVTDTNFPTVGYGGAAWTGYIVGTTLYATWTSGTIQANQMITATGIAVGTYIVSNLTGVGTSGSSTWTVSVSQTLASVGSPISMSSPTTPIRNLAYGAAYLDGSVYVLTTDGRIYGSNYEDSTTWNALNYLTKTSEADGGVALCKHLNYILAWGQWSGGVFYDAGNLTGSPLSRYEAAKTEIGCAAGTSVVQFSGTVGWIGQSREAGKGVFLMNGLTPQKVSTTSIDNYLNASVLNNGATPQVRAWALTIAGHSFYVITLKDLGLSFAYDLIEQEWYQWTTTNQVGTVLTETQLDSEFFAAALGSAYTLDGSDGNIYTVSTQNYSDGTNPLSSTGINPISWRVVTSPIDADNNSWKFFHSLEVMGDRSGAIMYIRHTDNDFASWSQYRPVPLVQSRPIIYQCGKSRNRSYEFYCIDNQPIRLHSAEFNIKLGS
jgi:hypothetical protein